MYIESNMRRYVDFASMVTSVNVELRRRLVYTRSRVSYVMGDEAIICNISIYRSAVDYTMFSFLQQ